MAITNYEKEMDQAIYSDESKKECIEYAKLKELNHDVTNRVIETFKQTAIGDNLKENEAKIMLEISQKYQRIKTQFEREYSKKLKNTLAKLVQPVESNIRSSTFKNPQDLMADINKLKTEFLEETKGSTFKQKELVLSQECERLVFKGMEKLYISCNNVNEGEKRQLTEKLNYLEQTITT
jgi:UDP-N-acetylglucosamine transferase subunit ALG13